MISEGKAEEEESYARDDTKYAPAATVEEAREA
jgi:hypothetical protein